MNYKINLQCLQNRLLYAKCNSQIRFYSFSDTKSVVNVECFRYKIGSLYDDQRLKAEKMAIKSITDLLLSNVSNTISTKSIYLWLKVDTYILYIIYSMKSTMFLFANSYSMQNN